jgi:hypothetical protein
MEFGGSGEDSFVAVVVTKLTGALLFILLMSLVIMALIPKAADLARPRPDADSREPLAVATTESLPEAIVGRPYDLALAATGGDGSPSWAVDGELPEGLTFEPDTGRIRGIPKKGTARPAELVIRVHDGSERAARGARLVVYQPDGPLTTPSTWKPSLPPIAWRAWLEQGFGFLVLLLVYLVGRGMVGSLERWSTSSLPAESAESARRAVRRRFAAYRALVGLTAASAMAALAIWLWRPQG